MGRRAFGAAVIVLALCLGSELLGACVTILECTDEPANCWPSVTFTVIDAVTGELLCDATVASEAEFCEPSGQPLAGRGPNCTHFVAVDDFNNSFTVSLSGYVTRTIRIARNECKRLTGEPPSYVELMPE